MQLAPLKVQMFSLKPSFSHQWFYRKPKMPPQAETSGGDSYSFKTFIHDIANTGRGF